MSFQCKTPVGFRLRNGRQVAQKRASYLFCDNRARGLGCANAKFYRYENLERSFVSAVIDAALRDSFFVQGESAAKISEAQYRGARELELQGLKVDRLLDLYSETGDQNVREKWSAAKAEESRLCEAARQLDVALARARGQVSPAEHSTRVSAVQRQLESGDQDERRLARAKVMSSLAELIDHIEFTGHGIIDMRFRGSVEIVRFDENGDILEGIAIASTTTAADQSEFSTLQQILDP
jgi:hypothetical protein